MELTGISFPEVIDNLLRLGLAFLLALPIGWDREQKGRSAGLRTFPLVAIGSCAFLLIGLSLLRDHPAAQGHVLYGLMIGIGFVGGGSILKGHGSVSGTATAASVWNTGAIGAGVASQHYEIAISLTLVNFLLLRFGQSAKELVPKERED